MRFCLKEDNSLETVQVSEVLNKGDVIIVEQIDEKDTSSRNMPKNSFYLRQLPNVEGALIAMNPHTAKI